jgi:hypothetical protein
MGCLEGIDVLRVQTVCAADWGVVLDQRQRLSLQPAYRPLSSPKTQRIPHAHGRSCVQPTAYDHPMHRRTGRWANQRIDSSTLCPPRSTLAALVLQRASSTATLRRMSTCGWASAHCALTQRGMRNAQQRLKHQARPGHPPFEELRVLGPEREKSLFVQCRRQRDAPWWLIASTCSISFQSRRAPPVISRQWGDCKRTTCASAQRVGFDVISCSPRLTVSIGKSLLPRNPTVSLSRLSMRCNRKGDRRAATASATSGNNKDRHRRSSGARSSPVSCENLVAWQIRNAHSTDGQEITDVAQSSRFPSPALGRCADIQHVTHAIHHLPDFGILHPVTS